ncbi:helix-turn-helix transcriptional regulator [Actinoplanes awajinensis]|uniref:Excisionase n=1 Tax=Actinoplanes awajinensis subsp. mycoplanecinus TaxID=135947 RepID=A0A101JE35_9ACTN|nr:helix-turn-helix domain-containing protein [Actinoplanes awajinensis]KUL25080.1 excisionase [Actinoplanes awajinensis subsp. mycoplanecinus]
MTTASVPATPIEGLWTIDDVSAFLRVPTATLYQWRHHRAGPPAFKVGRHLRYDPAAVRTWLASREV